MTFVTDTHPLVYHLTGLNRKLGRRAKAIFDRVDRGVDSLLVPFTVLEEIMLLSETGKIRLRIPFRELLLALMQAENFNLRENDADLLLEACALVGIRDPYDRMIVAQARATGFPLVTGEQEIQNSNLVRTVWE
jgi:PIN domain nuclease of toxin-antitoxin system